jgi:hypothetical protein
MILTRSMSAAAAAAAAKNANAGAKNAKAGAKNANTSKNAIASTPTSVGGEKLTPKQRRAERRRVETLFELSELNVSAIIETKRQRRPAQHPDLAFYRAAAIQAEDAGKRGGLITRSMHRHDYGYNDIVLI